MKWCRTLRNNADIARQFIGDVVAREGIEPGQAVIHADRGTEMTAQPVCTLLDGLGVAQSHSRPHVSNDNPYSESINKTLKYSPRFPDRFGSLQDGQRFCSKFFDWYNNEHRHSGIALLTPAMLHHGSAIGMLQARYPVMLAAHPAHPDRFIAGEPGRQTVLNAAWINQPADLGAAA